jgi:long-chain fatty acid transport protein
MFDGECSVKLSEFAVIPRRNDNRQRESHSGQLRVVSLAKSGSIRLSIRPAIRWDNNSKRILAVITANKLLSKKLLMPVRSAQSIVAACALAAGFSSVSYGLGIRVADQDARATARGNAFTATADNPSAIYYNPAGITDLYSPILNSPTLTPTLGRGKQSVPASASSSPGSDSGLRTRLGLYSITLANKVTPSASDSSFDISHRWQFAPSFYTTWKPGGSRFTFGFGIYAPYGFGIWYPEDSPIRASAISGSIQYLTINPVVACKLTDSLSVSAGPTFNYGRTALKRGLFPQTVFGGGDRFQFDGEGWAVGWNAGLMWRPLPKHSFGVMYRSQTEIEFEGSSTTVVPGVIDRSQSASGGIKFPQNVVVGYSFRPTEKWNFEVNLDWTDWDNLNTVVLHQAGGDIPLPFNWQSSLFYEFGASYKFDNGFVASIGYIYSENSVPNSSFNPIVPDSNRHIFSAGIGKSWDKWNFDLAYQFAHGQKRNVTQGAIPPDGTYQFDSHAISLSAGYNF